MQVIQIQPTESECELLVLISSASIPLMESFVDTIGLVSWVYLNPGPVLHSPELFFPPLWKSSLNQKGCLPWPQFLNSCSFMKWESMLLSHDLVLNLLSNHISLNSIHNTLHPLEGIFLFSKVHGGIFRGGVEDFLDSAPSLLVYLTIQHPPQGMDSWQPPRLLAAHAQSSPAPACTAFECCCSHCHGWLCPWTWRCLGISIPHKSGGLDTRWNFWKKSLLLFQH